MIWLLYTLNVALFIISIINHHYDVTAISIAIHILLSKWNHDKTQLDQLQDKIEQLNNTNEIIKIGKQKALIFKELNWFQKIIYLTAFKAGVEYTLNKLK